MFFLLSKILGILCHPIVWVFILMILALIKRSKKSGRRFLIAAITCLYFFSNQAIFYEFSSTWAMRPISSNELKEKYDVAIVLGGIVSLSAQNKQVEFHANADRFLNVLPLYFSGRVNKILISGGSGYVFNRQSEATILGDFLSRIGVDSKDIILESTSRNTYENAKYSIEVLREHKMDGPFLLSTSAVHMPRALMCFRALEFPIDAFPVDQMVQKRDYTLDVLFLPKASILQYWYNLIHEWVGILSYQLAGYI